MGSGSKPQAPRCHLRADIWSQHLPTVPRGAHMATSASSMHLTYRQQNQGPLAGSGAHSAASGKSSEKSLRAQW